jgi:hypothetical protein
MAHAAAAGLDFVAITDHVPVGASDLPRPPRKGAVRVRRPAPLSSGRVLRVPGLEVSPPGGHYLVLGLDPQELSDVSHFRGWPAASSFVTDIARRPGMAGFIAHPHDEGNPFLKIPSYRCDDWEVGGYSGLEVWNLSTDWSRHIKSYGEVLRAWAAGFYRAVPPPHPATLARWDQLARHRRVAGIAGTDAHDHLVRIYGLPVRILPYDRAFRTLQTGVWVDREALEGPAERTVGAIIEALRRGRAFMLNRALGHPLGFVFQARDLVTEGIRYVSGDEIPAGQRVRFEVGVPLNAWIRLVRNGEVVANTFGREMVFEPLEGEGSGEREAWRVEAWANLVHWSRGGSGFFLWILSNFVYRLGRPEP